MEDYHLISLTNHRLPSCSVLVKSTPGGVLVYVPIGCVHEEEEDGEPIIFEED